MSDLEEQKSLSAKYVLSTILLNQDTSTILDDYIISYLKLNPQLVNTYLDQNGLYHVYIRNRDPRVHNKTDDEDIIQLIKSFSTELDAKNWIVKNGCDLIKKHESYYHDQLVLIIIYDNNIISYDTHDSPFESYCISEKKYPTFVFSQDSLDMLIKEAKYFDCNSEREYHEKAIPLLEELTWVTYINY